MKQVLMLSVAALTMLAAAPAMAADHDGKHRDMFAKHDTNGDGMISKEEFLATAEKKFADMDTDGDGSISKAESDAKKAEWKEKMKERRAKMKDRMNDKVDEPAEEPAAE